MKYVFEFECPCGDHKIKILTETDSKKPEDLFCPFCSCLVEDEEHEEDEE